MNFLDDINQRKIKDDLGKLEISVQNEQETNSQEKADVAAIQEQIRALMKKMGCPEDVFPVEKDEMDLEDFQQQVDEIFQEAFPEGERELKDKHRKLSATDAIVAVLIGGLGVLVDFLIVRIPKGVDYHHGDKVIHQEGSPLTEFFRTLGKDSDGKPAAWVKWLEEQCKVSYDVSTNGDKVNVPGLNPKTHRIFSLGHDPLFGLVFAIYDIFCGNFTTIGKDGVLRIIKVADSADISEALFAVVKWFGHLLSDVTTKMGIPVPGLGIAQMLQVGDFGPKHRTIADLARYMYLNGYDMRHFATMATEPIIIGFMVHLYLYFTNEQNDNGSVSEREYDKLQREIKLQNMMGISLAVAGVGNIAKIMVYEVNPAAFNYPVWLAVLRAAIIQYKIAMRTTKPYEQVIEGRHIIDDRWDILMEKIKKIENYVDET